MKTKETKETRKVKIRFFRILKKNFENSFSVALPFYVFINDYLYFRTSYETPKFEISNSTLNAMEEDVRLGNAVEIELSEAVLSMTKELEEVLDYFKPNQNHII